MLADAVIRDIERDLVARATGSDESERVFAEFCEALAAAGLPLWRVSISVPAIDPLFQGVSLTWQPGTGYAFVGTEHGISNEDAFADSPIGRLYGTGAKVARWPLEHVDPDLPLLARLKAEGATDYVLHLADYAPGTALVGVGISFATDRAGGFGADDLGAFAALVPILALVTAKFSLAHTLRDVTESYLGARTAGRVLAGEMRRGQGSVVPAVILLADLRGFTALSERHPPQSVVGWLNEHLDALAEPVARHGGEILKFLGDGFLAIFPVEAPDAAPCPVCAAGVAAAREAVDRNRDLNRVRAEAGLPALEAALVLHYGEVVYGNVGAGRRLDFTIIGSAVNEASRIEALCGELDRTLLLSDAFAVRCGAAAVPLGTFSLRGLSRAQRIWALDAPGQAPLTRASGSATRSRA